MNRGVFVLIAVVVLAASPAALARTWTDDRGNKISAKFVRVHGGNVVLTRAGRVITVPFSNFSPADQDYIRSQLEANGQGSLVPPAARRGASSDGQPHGLRRVGPAAMDEDDDATSSADPEETTAGSGVTRTWTDIRGRTMEAELVGVSGHTVVLRKDGRRVTYPLAGFSPADQEYIGAQQGSGGIGPGSMPEMPGFDPADISGEPAEASSGDYGHEPDEEMDMSEVDAEPSHEYGRPPDEDHESEEDYGSTPEYAGSASGPHGPPEDHGQGSSGPPMPRGRATTDIPPPTGYATSPSKWMEEEEYAECGSCGREVPANLGAGDTCPHCGVKWDYEETADGRTVDASGNEVSGSCEGLGIGGSIVVGVLVVIGVTIRLMILFGRR